MSYKTRIQSIFSSVDLDMNQSKRLVSWLYTLAETELISFEEEDRKMFKSIADSMKFSIKEYQKEIS